MSYDGEYGPSETCRHDMYYRSCSVCSTIGAHPSEEKFAERLEEMRRRGADPVTLAAVSVPAGVADTSRVESWLKDPDRLRAVVGDKLWLVVVESDPVYFGSLDEAMNYGKATESNLYEAPLYHTARDAASAVQSCVAREQHLAGLRIDPATGKRSWGYMDLRDSVAVDPEWETYRRLKEKFEPESAKETAGSTA